MTNPATYRNPVLPGFHADPSACRVADDYYLVTSTFEYFPGVPIFKSRDLVHWRLIGHCLTRASQLPLAGAKSSQGIFAPTIRHHDGIFYMVTTNMSSGGSFYVTARDPAGEWSEPVWLNETTWSMDPSLFFDDDGKVYYTRHGGGERGGVVQAELDLASGQLKTDVRPIWPGTGGIWPEGPHLYKIGGRYYLLISEGGTSYDHMLTVARADSPWGPFEPCPHNPILAHRPRAGHPIQATGHADLVQAQNGTFWLVLLGIRPTNGPYHHLGRETFLASVVFDSAGWPVVNGGAGIELEMPSLGLPPFEAPPALPARDDFNERQLDLRWNFLRNPSAADWSLSERPGWLRLHGNATSLNDEGSPAFVGRRQQHFTCSVSTLIDCPSLGSDGEAGLCVRANEANHYALLIVAAPSGRRVSLRARRQGESELIAEAPLADGPVVLTIQAHPDRYEFSHATPGGPAHSLGTLPTTPLSTEQAGGFTGAFLALYAKATPADFDWFTYDPNE
jgi:xylan 1,4-beta-xylosidase